MSIRFTLEYQKQENASHLFLVHFYRPDWPGIGSCQLEIDPSGSRIFPLKDQPCLPYIHECSTVRDKILSQIHQAGKVYVAGINKKPIYQWTET